jgi:hypothetical protein
VTYDIQEEHDASSEVIEGCTVISPCISIHESGVVIDFDVVVGHVVLYGEGPVGVDHCSSSNDDEDIKFNGDCDDDDDDDTSLVQYTLAV